MIQYISPVFTNTGRQCDDPNCCGDLMDTCINFGESLPLGKS